MDKARETAAWKKPELFTYGVTNEEATRWGLPCGGTLQLVMEPLDQSNPASCSMGSSQQQLRQARDGQRRGDARARTGRTCSSSTAACSPRCTARWRLVLIGAGQLTRYLAEMARMLDYHVVVIDPREEYAAGWDLASVPINRGMPDDVVRELQLDGHSAIVALTHDPKLDDLALMEALKSAAFYVGAIGSKKNNDARRERLREFDVSDEEDRAPARPGRVLHRLEDPARDRGGDPCRDDRGTPRRERAELGREARTALRSLRL